MYRHYGVRTSPPPLAPQATSESTPSPPPVYTPTASTEYAPKVRKYDRRTDGRYSISNIKNLCFCSRGLLIQSLGIVSFVATPLKRRFVVF